MARMTLKFTTYCKLPLFITGMTDLVKNGRKQTKNVICSE